MYTLVSTTGLALEPHALSAWGLVVRFVGQLIKYTALASPFSIALTQFIGYLANAVLKDEV